jgi:predicted dehydrogenase
MTERREVSRRSFIQQTAGSTLAACLASGAAPALGAIGANERINLGFIATGDRNSFHISQFKDMPDVGIVALCDVDRSHLEKAAASLDGKPAQFEDFRKVLEMKEVDAVVVAPPEHWHAIPTIMACQAGKDVYVEKPLGHNIKEGRAIVDAAKKYNRIVAIGTQQRSGPHWIEAVEIIKSGKLGKISAVRCFNQWGINSMGGKGMQGIGNPPDSDPPEGVNYDRWLGPAPKRRFNPNRFHFYFYFFWDYSGGMVSAWGVHLHDIVLWAMGYDIRAVTCTGGNYVFKDNRETPDTAEVIWECPNYTFTYSVRHGNGRAVTGDMDHGIEFSGTDASLFINRKEYRIYPEDAPEKPTVVKARGMDIPHKLNFLECVRTRKQPNADALTGHLGTIPGYLANISYRVGRKIKWDAEKETIPGDEEACKLLTRTYREPWHLPI